MDGLVLTSKMVALNLEGSTLGARHKHLNQIINETIKSKKPFKEIVDIAETSDAVRIYKIAIASEYRNVDYIIENLCCDDMFYATVAINKSKWLITDKKYSNIVNPVYLNNELYPKMLAKAASKLSLTIRLTLNEPERVETFFNYYLATSHPKTAFKWLKNCSVNFKRDIVKKYYSEIDKDLLVLLCKLDNEVFQILASIEDYPKYELVNNFQFILYKQPENYLNFFETVMKNNCYYGFKGRRFVEYLMKNHRERILVNWETYNCGLSWKIVGSYLKETEIKNLIEHNVTETILSDDQVKALINNLPEEKRYNFVKSTFLDTKQKGISSKDYDNNRSRMIWGARHKPSTHRKDYSWYNYASFDVAFKELKPYINTSVDHSERIDIFCVFVKTARKNEMSIKCLLEYFIKRHINEPIHVKQVFVQQLVKSTDMHKYNASNWKLMNELFHNLEVFKKGGLSYCRDAIIVYNLLHNKDIPIIFLDYLNEDDANYTKISSEYKKQLDNEEGSKFFQFLLDEVNKAIVKSPFNNDKTREPISENEFLKSYKAINDKISFLKFWERDLTQYPDVINFLKHLIEWKFETKSKQNIDIPDKEIKRLLFEDLLKTESNSETLMYTLKHDINLIYKYKDVVSGIILENVPLKEFIYKVRVYFKHDFAPEILQMYLSNLTSIVEEEKGHREIVQGLCLLMKKEELEVKIIDYVPEKNKIVWSEESTGLLNVRKQFCLNMYRVRPMLDFNIAMKFADGDYLQWSIPSISQLCYNSQHYKFKEWISILMSGPISLKKLSLRFTANKLNVDDFLAVYDKMWIELNHPSIRGVLVKGLRTSIISEENDEKIQKKWVLLKKFLNELTFEEDRSVYPLLGQLRKLPTSVKAEYFVLGYKILKTLPDNLQCQKYIDRSIRKSVEFINEIDDNFYVALILERFDDHFSKNELVVELKKTEWDNIDLLVKFLKKSPTEASLMKRYNAIMPIVLNKCKDLWRTNEKTKKKLAKNILSTTVRHLVCENDDYMKENKSNLSFLFENILTDIFEFWDPLTMYENYLKLHFNLFYWQSVRDINLTQPEIIAKMNAKILDLLEKHKRSYFNEIMEQFKTPIVEFWRYNSGILAVAKNFIANSSNIDSVCIGLNLLLDDDYLEKDVEEEKTILRDISKCNPRLMLECSKRLFDVDQ